MTCPIPNSGRLCPPVPRRSRLSRLVRGLACCALALLACLGAPQALARPFPPPRPIFAERPQPLALVSVADDPLRLYVMLRDEQGDERLFFLDTAFSRTTCDDDFVAELGLTVEKTCARSHGELGKVPLGKAVLRDLELGGHRLPELHCAVRDLQSTSSVSHGAGVPVAGVLGANVLERFVLRIDPEADTVSLADPRLAGLERGPDTLRLKRENGRGPRVKLPVMVQDERVWLILDTGATRTCLDARRLDLPLVSERQAVTRASGRENRAQVTLRYHLANEVALAGHSLGSLQLLDRHKVRWLPGLAGQDILGRFTLTIDSRHKLLRVEAPGD